MTPAAKRLLEPNAERPLIWGLPPSVLVLDARAARPAHAGRRTRPVSSPPPIDQSSNCVKPAVRWGRFERQPRPTPPGDRNTIRLSVGHLRGGFVGAAQTRRPSQARPAYVALLNCPWAACRWTCSRGLGPCFGRFYRCARVTRRSLHPPAHTAHTRVSLILLRRPPARSCTAPHYTIPQVHWTSPALGHGTSGSLGCLGRLGSVEGGARLVQV